MTVQIQDIDRDVFQHEIIAAAEEMSAVLRRSAFSPIIWDMIDYACGILDPAGNMVAQAPTIPAQLGIMPMAFRETVKAIPLVDWREGDVVVCNDPYAGCTHTPDIVMFAPVYADGALVAIASSIAHHIDVGGRVPGTESATAVEIYEEGLLIPPLKAIDQGKRNDTFFKIFARNVRDPEASMGDLDAQMAACQVGGKAIVRLVGKYGVSGFDARCAAVADYAETVLTRVLLAYEGAKAEAMVLMEDDASSPEPMQLTVGVSIRNGRISLDFDGTSAQRPNGLNNPIASTISMVCYAVKVVFTPDLPQNEGFNRSLSITVPEGSILNPKAPAAVSVRHLTQQAVADVVLKALAEIAPEKSIAGTQISFPTFVVGGMDRRPAAMAARGGEAPYFVTCDIIGGGMGASEHGPGLDAVDTHGGNCALLSAEVMELTSPVGQSHHAHSGCRRQRHASRRRRHRAGIRDALRRPQPLRLSAADQARDRALGSRRRRSRRAGPRDLAEQQQGRAADPEQVRGTPCRHGRSPRAPFRRRRRLGRGEKNGGGAFIEPTR